MRAEGAARHLIVILRRDRENDSALTQGQDGTLDIKIGFAGGAAVSEYNSGQTVIADGGQLTIFWREDNHVLMTGPFAKVFTGEIDLGVLPPR